MLFLFTIKNSKMQVYIIQINNLKILSTEDNTLQGHSFTMKKKLKHVQHGAVYWRYLNVWTYFDILVKSETLLNKNINSKCYLQMEKNVLKYSWFKESLKFDLKL